jgi:hypothetical protein
MLLLDAPSTGKPINIFNKAEHNEGLPDDDGSSDDFDDIPSQHTHTFRDITVKKQHLHAVLTVLHRRQIVSTVLKRNTTYILHGML